MISINFNLHHFLFLEHLADRQLARVKTGWVVDVLETECCVFIALWQDLLPNH